MHDRRSLRLRCKEHFLQIAVNCIIYSKKELTASVFDMTTLFELDIEGRVPNATIFCAMTMMVKSHAHLLRSVEAFAAQSSSHVSSAAHNTTKITNRMGLTRKANRTLVQEKPVSLQAHSTM